jgi:hypothetical protein
MTYEIFCLWFQHVLRTFKDRVLSAEKYTIAALKGHVLKFHKISKMVQAKAMHLKQRAQMTLFTVCY